jgi:hypothetical protein
MRPRRFFVHTLDGHCQQRDPYLIGNCYAQNKFTDIMVWFVSLREDVCQSYSASSACCLGLSCGYHDTVVI